MAQFIGACLAILYLVFGVWLLLGLGVIGVVLWLALLAVIVYSGRAFLRYVGDPEDAYEIERRSVRRR